MLAQHLRVMVDHLVRRMSTPIANDLTAHTGINEARNPASPKSVQTAGHRRRKMQIRFLRRSRVASRHVNFKMHCQVEGRPRRRAQLNRRGAFSLGSRVQGVAEIRVEQRTESGRLSRSGGIRRANSEVISGQSRKTVSPRLIHPRHPKDHLNRARLLRSLRGEGQ
jgi:hypothetical protein